MAAQSSVTSQITGLFSLAVSLLTFVRLIVYLSSQWPASDLDGNQPCCGRFLWPLVWNLVLLNLFIIQHTVMASSGWKKIMQYAGFSASLYRQVYVILSCICLHLLISFSTPLPGPAVWHFDVASHPILWTTVVVTHGAMWLVVFLCAVVKDPLELVGLSGPNDLLKDLAIQPRHVGLVAFVLILWMQMTMTVERFLTALVFSLYITVGNQLSVRVPIK